MSSLPDLASGPGYQCYRLDEKLDPLALHRLNPERYPYLLQSVAHGPATARYDILFAFPQDTLCWQQNGILRYNDEVLHGEDFLQGLDRLWRQQAVAAATMDTPGMPGLPPFRGGWFLFLSYELVSAIEPSLKRQAGGPDLPLALAVQCPLAWIRDHAQQQDYIVCQQPSDPQCLAAMQTDIARLQHQAVPAASVFHLSHLHEEPPERYLAGIERVQHYIREGDVFQVNLSRLWQAQLDREIDSASLYQRLCNTNPAPFAGLMRLGRGCAIVSSSPERLVKVEQGRINTRPIAGTFARLAQAQADQEQAAALLRHPKERAEHIMLLDLERNDLGRVCRYGSVQVAELMVVESYRHVHHIVSEVRGRLRPGMTPAQVIRAVFPGGTITGCPKVRCMEIISELETQARGPYTGSMGYLNHDGDMDLNILIRSLYQQGDNITLRAGGGIVADSIPERELQETHSKAKGMLAALQGPV